MIPLGKSLIVVINKTSLAGSMAFMRTKAETGELPDIPVSFSRLCLRENMMS